MKNFLISSCLTFIFFSCTNSQPSTKEVEEKVYSTINLTSNNKVELLQYVPTDGVDTLISNVKYFKIKFTGEIRYKVKGYSYDASYNERNKTYTLLNVYDEKPSANSNAKPVNEKTTKKIFGHILYSHTIDGLVYNKISIVEIK